MRQSANRFNDNKLENVKFIFAHLVLDSNLNIRIQLTVLLAHNRGLLIPVHIMCRLSTD